MDGPLTMQQFGATLRRRWFVVVIALIVGAAGGYVGSRFITPTYSATATQLVKGISFQPGANYQAAQFAAARAESYPALIQSPQVLDGVRDDLGDGTSTNQLSQDLTASNPAGTPLVQVTARAHSARVARQMANSAARHMATYIAHIESVGGKSPVSVEIAVQAALPSAPISPRPLLNAALVAVVLACLSVAALLIADRGAAGTGRALRVDDQAGGEDEASPAAASDEPSRDAEADAQTDAEATANANAEVDADADAEVDAEAEADAEAEVDAEADPDADAKTGAGAGGRRPIGSRPRKKVASALETTSVPPSPAV